MRDGDGGIIKLIICYSPITSGLPLFLATSVDGVSEKTGIGLSPDLRSPVRGVGMGLRDCTRHQKLNAEYN